MASTSSDATEHAIRDTPEPPVAEASQPSNVAPPVPSLTEESIAQLQADSAGHPVTADRVPLFSWGLSREPSLPSVDSNEGYVSCTKGAVLGFDNSSRVYTRR